MQANLYAIGFSVLTLGFLPTGEIQGQQLLSHVKTENFNHSYYGYYDETDKKTITEQVYNYNDKNAITKYASWTTTAGIRTLNNQTVYTYNEDGNTLSTVTEQLDYATQELNLQGRTDYKYNADGKVASMVYQYRDYVSKDMVYSYRYEYLYGSGETVESKVYNWNVETDDWVEQPPYDVITDEVMYDGEWGDGVVLGTEPAYNGYDFSYNKDSTMSTAVSKAYHKRSDTWNNSSRTVNQLNASQFVVSSLTETWNQYCKVWVPSYKSTTKYNKNNASILNEYHMWDAIGEEWMITSRTTSTYIDPKPIIKKIDMDAEWSLFPNPSDGDLFIELEEGKSINTRIEVMNKLGQTVYADRISASETEAELDLDFLPNGNYIVRLDDGESSSSLQMVIQK